MSMSKITQPPAWLAEAEKLIGLKEVRGSKHNPEIVKLFAETGHAWVKDDETAWCAAFVGAVLARVGVKGTGKLNARSYLDWGMPLDRPVPGCIVIFSRGNPNGWQGHVAFFQSETGSYVTVTGGNQSNAVTTAKYSKARLLGYRWPAGVPLPDKAAPAPPVPVARTLRRGAKGEAVSDLQRRLRSMGILGLKIDGDFGPATERGVVMAQKKLGLTPDGIAGPLTLAALRSYSPPNRAPAASPLPDPTPAPPQTVPAPQVPKQATKQTVTPPPEPAGFWAALASFFRNLF